MAVETAEAERVQKVNYILGEQADLSSGGCIRLNKI
jgi:hypothetical protein